MWIKTDSGVHYNCDRFDSIHFIGTAAGDGFMDDCAVVGIRIMEDRKQHLTHFTANDLSASAAAKIVARVFEAMSNGAAVFDLNS